MTRLRVLIGSILKRPRGLQRKPIIIASVACIALVASLLVFNNSKMEATVLMVDGNELAVVSNVSQTEGVLERIKAEYLERGITLAECTTQITYDDKLVRDSSSPVNDQTLYSLLRDRLIWEVQCTAIEVNGEPAIYLANEEDALQTLDNIKKYYVPETDGLVSVEEVSFVENVQIATAQAAFSEIKGPDSALETLIKGEDRIVQHTVEDGDSLWTIAKANNMTVTELREANPELGDSDRLKLGMLLNLVKVEPLVQVATVLTTTVEEAIPYKTVYKDNSSVWRGQQQIEQKGEYGSRQVTYRITKSNGQEIKRETLDDKLLRDPVDKVVQRGTKVMVASRGDGGSGILAWPSRGSITSVYGAKRGSSRHTGTDIDGSTGDPIFAAGDGVILEARWKGNYGNCVIIDHGDGLTTLYGHLSKIKVSTGQSVKRGDIIGLMGSTGRSTGSHLHFEVCINGVRQNPMRFLE